jgi:hypothetical protein
MSMSKVNLSILYLYKVDTVVCLFDHRGNHRLDFDEFIAVAKSRLKRRKAKRKVHYSFYNLRKGYASVFAMLRFAPVGESS